MVAGGSDSGPKDADMVAAVAKAWPMSEFTPYRSSLSWCFRLLSQLVIPCYFHMRGLFNCGQVKAVAREQHLEEEKKVQKPKRKRGKQADPTAPVPPSPQRVAKKVKPPSDAESASAAAATDQVEGDKDEGEAEVQDSKAEGEAQGEEPKAEGEAKAKAKAKSKRKGLEEVKEAWKVKDGWFLTHMVLFIEFDTGKLCCTGVV